MLRFVHRLCPLNGVLLLVPSSLFLLHDLIRVVIIVLAFVELNLFAVDSDGSYLSLCVRQLLLLECLLELVKCEVATFLLKHL